MTVDRSNLNPRPPAYEDSVLTTILIWQVIVKGVKVCVQQTMSKHSAVGSELGKKKKCRLFSMMLFTHQALNTHLKKSSQTLSVSGPLEFVTPNQISRHSCTENPRPVTAVCDLISGHNFYLLDNVAMVRMKSLIKFFIYWIILH